MKIKLKEIKKGDHETFNVWETLRNKREKEKKYNK